MNNDACVHNESDGQRSFQFHYLYQFIFTVTYLTLDWKNVYYFYLFN